MNRSARRFARDWTRSRRAVAEGIERQMVYGEQLMICRLTIRSRTSSPPCTRIAHEQMTIVERGRVRFIIDGSSASASAGDVLHFPPHVPHGATMLDEEVVLVDIFTPLREDFLAPKQSA